MRLGLMVLVTTSCLFLVACGPRSAGAPNGQRRDNGPSVTLPPDSVELAVNHTTPLDSAGLAAAIADDHAGINALGRIAGSDARLLFDATSKVGADCMTGAGYADFPADSFQPAPEFSPASRPAAEGYLLLGTSRAAGSAAPERSARDVWLADHPSARKAWGEEAGGTGCVVDAFSIVYGSKSGPFEVWKRLTAALDAWDASIRDSAELGAVDAAWSKCMADQGIEAVKPSSLWARRWPGATPGAEEIATRTADLECRTGVDYSSRRAQALAPLLDRWLTENRELVADTRAAIDQWLANARAVLKSG